MPSPFPGMDPYLEGALWPDVHQQLAYDLSIDYSALPPPPELSSEDAAWLRTLVKK